MKNTSSRYVMTMLMTIIFVVLQTWQCGYARENRNDFVLNPLPSSVLLDVGLFSVKEIDHVDINGEHATILYHGVGDMDLDNNPEIFISGWTFRGWEPEGYPPTAMLHVFEADNDRTVRLPAQNYLGAAYTAGTAFINVADYDLDGRPDLLITGHNESPFINTENVLYFNEQNGFRTVKFGPYMTNHEGNTGDFNNDGYPDFIASAYHCDMDFSVDPTGNEKDSGAMILFLNDRKGGFDYWAIRFNKAVESFSGNYSELEQQGGRWMSSGSASAFGNLDNDPESEIVVVDAWVDSNIEPNRDSWIIDNIQFEEKHAYGDLIQLPEPYLENNPLFEDNPSNFESKSHDIHVEIFDFNNDGKNDIIINSMIWVEDGYDGAGVVQFLANNGNMEFLDVTDETLHNYYMGNMASHDPRFMDVNQDGFIDIILTDHAYDESLPRQWGTAPDTWAGEIYQSVPNTWANEILINTGSGKFVSTFWEGFHQLTLKQEVFFASKGSEIEPYNLIDQSYFPYLLGDGRLGFVTFNGAYPSKKFFFDVRASAPLYTGPNGTETATIGAPGYSEYYYITENNDVTALIFAGDYKNGLQHYLAVGKEEGRHAFAANAFVHGHHGDDIITLREGNETAYGYDGNDVIYGCGGDDTLIGGNGSNVLDGGEGYDVAIYSGPFSEYTVEKTQTEYTVVKSDGSVNDKITNIQALQFSDKTVSLAGLTISEVSQLYVAIFGRASEGSGNAYWRNRMDIAAAADDMLDTGAAKEYFGASLNSNRAFIEHIYLNTLNKTDDSDGIGYWTDLLDENKTRGQVVAELVTVIENYAPGGPSYDPNDVAAVAAYNQFVNRVAVSDYMAETVEEPPEDWVTSTSFNNGMAVSDDPATVISAKASVDSF